jgi:hypothetical protein
MVVGRGAVLHRVNQRPNRVGEPSRGSRRLDVPRGTIIFRLFRAFSDPTFLGNSRHCESVRLVSLTPFNSLLVDHTLGTANQVTEHQEARTRELEHRVDNIEVKRFM